MVSIHNYEKRYKRILERLEQSKDISSINKKWIFGFKDNLLSDGIGLAKIERYLGDLFKFNRFLGKPFEEANKEDIRRVVSGINQEPLSEETKRCFKIMVRKLYCYIRGIDERGVYPDEVRWMRMELGVKNRKLPEKLLTEEEITSMIKMCRCVRDKALIATLSESGSRVSEVGLMKIKHVSFETYGARIVAILKTAGRDAEIKKRIHPHLLRHSRATQLASLMSDSQLKHYLGWTQSSKMAGIYVHMSGKDVDSAILKANNIEVENTKKEPLLKPIPCFRCKRTNPATNNYCNGCGFILNQETAKKMLVEEHQEEDMGQLLTRLLQDKEVQLIFARKMEELKR